MLVNWAYCQTNKILFPAQVASYFLFSLKWISSSFISYFISSSLVAAVPCWILNGAQLILIDAHFWILETKCFSMFWHTNKVKSFSSLCHFAHFVWSIQTIWMNRQPVGGWAAQFIRELNRFLGSSLTLSLVNVEPGRPFDKCERRALIARRPSANQFILRIRGAITTDFCKFLGFCPESWDTKTKQKDIDVFLQFRLF